MGLNEKEKVADQITYYDDLIAGYLTVIQQLNVPDAPADAQALIKMATESIDHCEDKRTILINYQKTLD